MTATMRLLSRTAEQKKPTQAFTTTIALKRHDSLLPGDTLAVIAKGRTLAFGVSILERPTPVLPALLILAVRAVVPREIGGPTDGLTVGVTLHREISFEQAA